MELRGCDTTHFIQTIRGGLVLKVQNITSHERSIIRFKSLNDVYESEDTKRLQKHPSGNHQQVQQEDPSFMVADSTIREIKPEIDEFAPCYDDDLGGCLDDETTLKQLKKRLLSKKRKLIPVDEDSQHDNANEKAKQDESYLNEPLINWKSKHSKTSKAKHLKTHVISSSSNDVAIKSEENLVSESSHQAGSGRASISVKVEALDAEQSEFPNEISSGDASSTGYNENSGQMMVLNEYNREPPLCVNCATNEICYDHLEDVQPISVFFPWDGTSVKLETPEASCRDSPDLNPCMESLSEDPNPDLCSNSRSLEDMPEEGSIVGHNQECNSVQSKDKIEADFSYESNDFPNSLDKNCGSITPSKTEEHQTLVEGPIEDESLKAVERQTSAFTVTGAETEASLENRAETDLIVEPLQSPVRLTSTRKAFSSSSQEQQKIAVSPRCVVRKSQIAKGNLEGPRHSRAFTFVSTSCTSIEGCSEGAITFSQRQMHDMETLAEKLMDELKAMKGIVEQKLLFEAYRNASVKNDADEVKSAINKATKVEDIAKRWMSMMARDCIRFCKIMKMTTESTPASKDASMRETRKVKFADEAGGELCRFKFL